jgi:hypothetical protein
MPAALRAAGILPPHQSPKDQPELYNKLALPRVGGRVAVGYVVCILALFRCRSLPLRRDVGDIRRPLLPPEGSPLFRRSISIFVLHFGFSSWLNEPSL